MIINKEEEILKSIIAHIKCGNNDEAIKSIKTDPEILSWKVNNKAIYKAIKSSQNNKIIELIIPINNALITKSVKENKIKDFLLERLMEYMPDIDILKESLKISEQNKNEGYKKILNKIILSYELIEELEKGGKSKKIQNYLDSDASVRYETKDNKTAYKTAVKNCPEFVPRIIEKLFDETRGNLEKDNSKDMIDGLITLTEKQNSKDIHFIFELIQNAEDNDYDQELMKKNKTDPFICFNLYSTPLTLNNNEFLNYLHIINNEKGFNDSNLKSICSATESTKKKKDGFIGEKGVGFKSVFKVTDSPYIFSNGFNFYFRMDDPKAPVVGIYPYNDVTDVPRIVDLKNTNIILPMKSGNYDIIKNELKNIKMETILFLDKLKIIIININMPDGSYNGKKFEKIDIEKNIISVHDGEINQKYWIFKHNIIKPYEINIDIREDVKDTNIILAMPLENEISNNKLYCYLPTEIKTGFPFLLNCDFILLPNREDFEKNNIWNDWIQSKISASFILLFCEMLKHEIYKFESYRFIPLISETYDYFQTVAVEINRLLGSFKSIIAFDGNMYKPENIRLIDDESAKILLNSKWPKSVDIKYDIPGFLKHEKNVIVNNRIVNYSEKLELLGCKYLSALEKLECITDKEWLEQKLSSSPDWINDLYHLIFDEIYRNEKRNNFDQLINVKEILLDADFLLTDEGSLVSPRKIIFLNDEQREILVNTPEKIKKNKDITNVSASEKLYKYKNEISEINGQKPGLDFNSFIDIIENDKNFIENVINSISLKYRWHDNLYDYIFKNIYHSKLENENNNSKIFLGYNGQVYKLNDFSIIDKNEKKILIKLYGDEEKLCDSLRAQNIIQPHKIIYDSIYEYNEESGNNNHLGEEKFLESLKLVVNGNNKILNSADFEFYMELYEYIFNNADFNYSDYIEIISNIKLFLGNNNKINYIKDIFVLSPDETAFFCPDYKLKELPENFKNISNTIFLHESLSKYLDMIRKNFNGHKKISNDDLLEILEDSKWIEKRIFNDNEKSYDNLVIFNAFIFSKVHINDLIDRGSKFIPGDDNKFHSSCEILLVAEDNTERKFFKSFKSYLKPEIRDMIPVNRIINFDRNRKYFEFIKPFCHFLSPEDVKAIIKTKDFNKFLLSNKSVLSDFYDYIFLNSDRFSRELNEENYILGFDKKFYRPEKIKIIMPEEKKILSNFKLDVNLMFVPILDQLIDGVNRREKCIELGCSELGIDEFIESIKCSCISLNNVKFVAELYEYLNSRSIPGEKLVQLNIIIINEANNKKAVNVLDDRQIIFFPASGSKISPPDIEGFDIKILNSELYNELSGTLKDWLKKNFNVKEEFSHVSYINDVIIKYFENGIELINKDVIYKITDYLAETMAEWKKNDDVNKRLDENIIFITADNELIKHAEVDGKTIVMPENMDELTGWQNFLVSPKDRGHIISLNSSYAVDLTRNKKEQIRSLFKKFGVTEFPDPPARNNIEPCSIDITSHENFCLERTPAQYQFFIQTNYIAPEWLKKFNPEKGYDHYRKNIMSLINWLTKKKDDEINNFLYCYMKSGRNKEYFYLPDSKSYKTDFYITLLTTKWMLSCKKENAGDEMFICPLDIFSGDKLTNIFADNVRYLSDKIKVDDNIKKILKIQCDDSFENYVEYLKSFTDEYFNNTKNNFRKPDLNVIKNIYHEFDRVKTEPYIIINNKKVSLFNELLEFNSVLIDAGNNIWINPKKTGNYLLFWNDHGLSKFSEEIIWLKDYYNDYTLYDFFKKLKIVSDPDIETYCKVYIKIQDSELNASKNIVSVLTNFYSALTRAEDKVIQTLNSKYFLNFRFYTTENKFVPNENLCYLDKKHLCDIFGDSSKVKSGRKVDYFFIPERFQILEIDKILKYFNIDKASDIITISTNPGNLDSIEKCNKPLLLTDSFFIGLFYGVINELKKQPLVPMDSIYNNLKYIFSICEYRTGKFEIEYKLFEDSRVDKEITYYFDKTKNNLYYFKEKFSERNISKFASELCSIIFQNANFNKNFNDILIRLMLKEYNDILYIIEEKKWELNDKEKGAFHKIFENYNNYFSNGALDENIENVRIELPSVIPSPPKTIENVPAPSVTKLSLPNLPANIKDEGWAPVPTDSKIKIDSLINAWSDDKIKPTVSLENTFVGNKPGFLPSDKKASGSLSTPPRPQNDTNALNNNNDSNKPVSRKDGSNDDCKARSPLATLVDKQNKEVKQAGNRSNYRPEGGPHTKKSAAKDKEEYENSRGKGKFKTIVSKRYYPDDTENEFEERFENFLRNDTNCRCQICGRSFANKESGTEHIFKPKIFDRLGNHFGNMLALCGWHFSLIKYATWKFISIEGKVLSTLDEIINHINNLKETLSDDDNVIFNLEAEFYNVYEEDSEEPKKIREKIMYSVSHWDYFLEFFNDESK